MFFSAKKKEDAMGSEGLMPSHLSEVLFSKMSHDIASPAGATENGIELLQEGEGDLADEAMSLIRDSARTVSTRLRFYRLAYGTSAGCQSLNNEALQQLVAKFFMNDKRMAVSFGANQESLSNDAKKLLLNMMLAAADALPHGGKLAAAWAGDLLTVSAVATVSGKPVKQGSFQKVTALEDIPHDLSPYTVQAWYTGYLVWHLGVEMSIKTEDPGVLLVEASLPR